MEREAQLLQLLEGITDTMMEPAGAAAWGNMRAAAMNLASAAEALALPRTGGQALALAGLLDATVAPGGAADWPSPVEDRMTELRQTAESELAAHMRAQSVTISPEACIPIAEFILEVREHLAVVENDLLQLEHHPDTRELIHSTLRSFHTIKGLAAVAGLLQARAIAHQAEACLEMLRDHAGALTPALVDALLLALDFLEKLVSLVELEDGYDDVEPADAAAVLEALNRQFAALHPGSPAPAEAPPPTPPAPAEPPRQSVTPVLLLKVESAKLDQLVDMIGELVVAQWLVQLDPALTRLRDSRTTRNMHQLRRITADLQRIAMALRVVPIRQTFRRAARIFRDLVRDSGKQAVIELAGEESELDRAMVEQLADPLMHIIRNAVDHGLETPAERLAAGKPAVGQLHLTAAHHSGNVVIEIADDGPGLDEEKIRQKAIAAGILSPLAELSASEIHDLIFEPGLSTAATNSTLSGRGVGMDIVRRQVEALRGRVEVHSWRGHGVVFSLRIPLTLAIIEALVVEQGGQRYILPLFSLREILGPGSHAIHTIAGNSQFLTVRGRSVPVRRLGVVLGHAHPGKPVEESVLVVVEAGGSRMALAVDAITGKQEVVIKGLGEWLNHIPLVAGGAILGDGSVGIILDLDNLASGAIDNQSPLQATVSSGSKDLKL